VQYYMDVLFDYQLFRVTGTIFSPNKHKFNLIECLLRISQQKILDNMGNLHYVAKYLDIGFENNKRYSK